MKARVKAIKPALILGSIAFVMFLITQAKKVSDKKECCCNRGTFRSEHFDSYRMSDNKSSNLFAMKFATKIVIAQLC